MGNFPHFCHMDFGKLSSVDHVDFALPPDPAQNAAFLAGLPPQEESPRIYIGATGYNMKPWVGTWYPTGTKDKDFLRHYGAQFNTIEHNTTHYRIPDAATVRRWRAETPADFRFCPKIPQTISHARDLGLGSGQIAEFCERIIGLEDRLGDCFLQLPPHFDGRQLPMLERFLTRWPAAIPLGVEVRNESFFNGGPLAGHYFDLLQAFRCSAVITEVSGRRDVCHLRLTAPRTLVRFVGNDLHPTDYTRLQDWAQRLKFWISQGLPEVYFFTHEPDNLRAPELAAFAAQVFREAIPEATLRGPQMIEPPAAQGVLF